METLIGSQIQEPVQLTDVARNEFVQLVNNVLVASAAGLHEAALGFHRDVEAVGASRSFTKSSGVNVRKTLTHGRRWFRFDLNF
jgi:hypothetical protein